MKVYTIQEWRKSHPNDLEKPIMKSLERKVLHLTLKKKWFDMILSGEKKEEYRELKRYWIQRLTNEFAFESKDKDNMYKDIDFVKFTNGYGRKSPSLLIECKGISIGAARPEWSDDWQGDVFVIKLGKILWASRIAQRAIYKDLH
jgi:hypothetical protein